MYLFRYARQIFRRSLTISEFDQDRVGQSYFKRFGAYATTTKRFTLAIPSLVSYAFKGDLNAKRKAKSTLAIDGDFSTSVRLFNGNVFTRQKFKKKTKLEHNARPLIILPVYNAFDDVSETLERLWDNYYGTLLLINDASTDERISPLLRGFHEANPDRCQLIENPENLGRVACFNLGMRRAAEENRIAVLLHSDVSVPRDWMDRLISPILRDDNVASVTPFTNQGAGFGIPVANSQSTLRQRDVDRIDIVARALRAAPTDLTVPTGQNFCMAMNPRYLRIVPQFDDRFGSGFLEDVDWCQKTRELDGRHVLAADLFVQHKGSASFGDGMKNLQMERNAPLIKARYPSLSRELLMSQTQDTFISWRFVLGIAYLSTIENVNIYFASCKRPEFALEQKIKMGLDANEAIVIVWVQGDARWIMEIVTNSGRVKLGFKDIHWLLRVLMRLPEATLEFSSALKSPDYKEELGIIKRLHSRHDSKLTVQVREDFFKANQFSMGDADPEKNLQDWIGHWKHIAMMPNTNFSIKSGIVMKKVEANFGGTAANIVDETVATQGSQEPIANAS